jgi:hypothetical protein
MSPDLDVAAHAEGAVAYRAVQGVGAGGIIIGVQAIVAGLGKFDGRTISTTVSAVRVLMRCSFGFAVVPQSRRDGPNRALGRAVQPHPT